MAAEDSWMEPAQAAWVGVSLVTGGEQIPLPGWKSAGGPGRTGAAGAWTGGPCWCPSGGTGLNPPCWRVRRAFWLVGYCCHIGRRLSGRNTAIVHLFTQVHKHTSTLHCGHFCGGSIVT